MILSPVLISKQWFTLVELIVGMTIFAVGMTAILWLLNSSIDTAILSRHEIVASNLLREQIELIKNTRNTNLRSYTPWNSILLDGSTPDRLKNGFFTLENDYTTARSVRNAATGNFEKNTVFMKEFLPPWFSEALTLEEKFTTTRLYFDEQNRFTHTATDRPTKYASYLRIAPLKIDTATTSIEPKKDGISQWYIIDARVISETRGNYREFDLKTIITDWKK